MYSNSNYPPSAPRRGLHAGQLALPPHQPVLKPFPIHALRGLLGALAMCLRQSGIDPAIVGVSLIAFASLLTQGVADVLRSGGRRSPLSVPVYLVAPSGSGKSDIYDLLMAIMGRALQDIVATLPPNIHPSFLMEDVTREAMVLHLKEWPFAGLFTDEGGQLDLLFRNGGPHLAKLLTAAPFASTRVLSGRTSLLHYRFTAFLGEQPHIFEQRKAQFAGGRGSVGWLNRFTLAVGQSFEATADPELLPEVEARFAQRVHELLTASVKNACDPKRGLPVVQLDRIAAEYLEHVRNHREPFPISPEMQVHTSEYLARRAERMHKLAGVLHVVENGPEGEISLQTMQDADQIGVWSIGSFLSLTYETPKPTQGGIDAAVLEKALNDMARTLGTTAFRLKELRRYAPNFGLTKYRFEKALVALAGSGKVSVVLHGRDDWVRILAPCDLLFTC